MTQTQRARLEEVQSEKAGITFNHVQRASVSISSSEFVLTYQNPKQLHRQRYDELLKATVAKVVAKTANVMIGEIVEKGKPVSRLKVLVKLTTISKQPLQHKERRVSQGPLVQKISKRHVERCKKLASRPAEQALSCRSTAKRNRSLEESRATRSLWNPSLV